MGVTLDSLGLLKQLSAKTPAVAGRSEAAAGKDDYAAVLAKAEAAEAEWQQTLRDYDLQKYKLSLADSFWTDSTKSQNFAIKYLQSEQKKANQASLTNLLGHLMTLQRVSQYAAANGTMDTETANAIGRDINTAMQNTFMLSLMNMNIGNGNSLSLTLPPGGKLP